MKCPNCDHEIVVTEDLVPGDECHMFPSGFARFLDCNGHTWDLDTAHGLGMKKGDVYEVEGVTMFDYHSYVHLKAFPGINFNTVCFEDSHRAPLPSFLM